MEDIRINQENNILKDKKIEIKNIINKVTENNLIADFIFCNIDKLNLDKNNDCSILCLNKNIYKYFIYKYSKERHINYLLKTKSKHIKTKNNKLNKSYICNYVFFYIYIYINKSKYENNKNGSIFDKHLISIKQFFKIIKILFKSDLLASDALISLLKVFILNIKIKGKDTNKDINKLSINSKVKTLTDCIIYARKIMKLISKSHLINLNIKEFFTNLYQDIILEIFDIINNKNNDDYISIINLFRKEESILILLEILKSNEEFINEKFKAEIETNIVEFLVNNFRKEHYNYFYKIISKILFKFHNLKNRNDYSLLLKQDFSLLSLINEILIKVINKEEKLIKNKDNYYCDKGFVFNNTNLTSYGMTIKNVINNYNKKSDHNFCLLFTFLSKINFENKKDHSSSYILLSILDNQSKELFSLYIKDNNLYLKYFSKSLIELKIKEKIKSNNYYSFFMFYDKKEIKISINNDDVLSYKETKFELPNIININIGYFEPNNSQYSSFNGIICPIILFNLKDKKNKKDSFYKDTKDLLLRIKNNYYIIGEECSSYDDYNTLLYYYGLFDELKNKNYVLELYNNIQNIILYINPTIIINSFNKRAKVYTDDKNYIDVTDSKGKTYKYSYEFNVVPSLENNNIFSFKDNNIVSFFKLNNGMNYLILELETMYNFILLKKNKNTNDNTFTQEDYNLM